MKKQLLLVSLLTGISQLAAFFKLFFTARTFGVGSELDAYNLALIAPTMISAVLAGFLQTGLFPVRSRVNQESGPSKVDSFDRTIWWIYAALGASTSTVLFVFSEWLARVIVPAGQEVTLNFFLSIMPIAAFLVAISMITDCTGYILAMRGSFLTAAGAPIANGVLGGVILAAWPQYGIDSLIWGTVCGAIVQLLICVYGLRLASIRLRGPLSFYDYHAFGEMVRLGAWIMPAVIFSNLAVSLPQMWAATFGEGAASAFGYAYRLHSSAIQLLIMASSTLILARFSVLVVSGDAASVRKMLQKAAIVSLGLGVFAVFCVATFGQYVLRLFFHGKFDAAAAEQVAGIWALLTLGLGPVILGNVFAKLWQALARPKLLSIVSGVSFAVLCLSFLIFRNITDERSIALAITCSAISSLALLSIRFFKVRS